MTVSALATAGYICDPASVTINLTVQESITASVTPDDLITASIDGVFDVSDLTLKRGDSRNIAFVITESDQITRVDLTGSVLKFAVKRYRDSANTDAFVFKTSYDSGEIEFTDAAQGEATVKLCVADTYNDCAGDWYWDLELTKQGALITSAGSISVTAGSGTITTSGVPVSDVKVGDILVPSGGTSPNQNPVTITATDTTLNTLTTDYTNWDTESAFSYTIYRGDRKTPTCGTFTIVADVVR